MNEEKMRILKLLEEKKISSAEAMELLEAMGKASPDGGGREKAGCCGYASVRAARRSPRCISTCRWVGPSLWRLS